VRLWSHQDAAAAAAAATRARDSDDSVISYWPAQLEPVGGARGASLAQCSRGFLGNVVFQMTRRRGGKSKRKMFEKKQT